MVLVSDTRQQGRGRNSCNVKNLFLEITSDWRLGCDRDVAKSLPKSYSGSPFPLSIKGLIWQNGNDVRVVTPNWMGYTCLPPQIGH